MRTNLVKTSKKKRKLDKINLHIILYSEDGGEIAHCLEFDLVAQGKSKSEALKNLLDAIELQVDFALDTNTLDKLYNPAPAEYWNLPNQAKKYTYRLKRKVPSFIANLDCHYVVEDL